MRTPAIVLATAVGMGMYAHNAAAQPTNITECRTITEPGSYVLVRNLSAAGDCLVIDADFVTIDLAGFVITGNSTGTGIRADPVDPETLRLGIAVRNGTITGFGSGIFVRGSATIEGMRVIGNTDGGIFASPSSIVSGNIAQENGGHGIVAVRIVSGNISTGNSFDGIVAGVGSIVSGNTVVDNEGRGIAGNRGSTIIGNLASGNSQGIAAAEGSTISSNAVFGNGGLGISVGEGSTVTGNTAGGNTLTGISVRCPSNVIGNTAVGNAEATRPNLTLEGNGCNSVDNVAPIPF